MFSFNSSSVLIPSLKLQNNDDLVQNVNRYLDYHPEVSRESFLRNALSRELQERSSRSEVVMQTISSEEDVRNHAWLEEQLNAMRLERHGLLERLRGFVFGTH